jgi:pantoate--beta-alanine ligase
VYLSPEERKAATIISRTLDKIEHWLNDINLTFPQLVSRAKEEICQEPLAQIDYIECLQYPSFSTLPDESCQAWLNQHRKQRILIAVAVKFGRTRLIDNRLLGGGHRV